MKNSEITIRDFTENDVIAQDEYFKNASDEFLYNMGVEVSVARNLPPSSRAKQILSLPVKERSLHTYAVDLNNNLVGVCVVKKIQLGKSADMHAHIFNLEHRHRGYATRIFLQILENIFQTFEVKVLICEPCVTNLAPNAFLEKMGFRPVAQVLTPAGGVLREHLANRYEIKKEFFDELKSRS